MAYHYDAAHRRSLRIAGASLYNRTRPISSLAYIGKCRTLPLYDDQVSVERAWTILLKHLSPEIRAAIMIHHVRQNPSDTILWPEWKQFHSQGAASQWGPLPEQPGAMHLTPSSTLSSSEPGTYYHRVRSFGLCRIVRVYERVPFLLNPMHMVQSW